MKNALVVDDSKLARLSLGKILDKLGMSVDSVENGRQAVDYLQRNDVSRPDVIFMDYLMPEMNGYEATQAINSNPRTKDIPVIICTSQEDVEKERERARSYGARGFIKKPITDEKITKALSDLDNAPVIDEGSGKKSEISKGGAADLSKIQPLIDEAVKAAMQKLSARVTHEILEKLQQHTSNMVMDALQKNLTAIKNQLANSAGATDHAKLEVLEKRIARIEQFLSKRS